MINMTIAAGRRARRIAPALREPLKKLATHVGEEAHTLPHLRPAAGAAAAKGRLKWAVRHGRVVGNGVSVTAIKASPWAKAVKSNANRQRRKTIMRNRRDLKSSRRCR